MSIIAGGARTTDGALIVRQDPGTEATDPRFRCGQFVVAAAAGDHWFDLPVPLTGEARLQYVVAQVRGACLGDRLEVVFRSTGQEPGLPPLDTVLQTFGEVHPAMHADARGWSVPRREPQDLGSAKLLPLGVKASVRYTCADATGRDLIVDCCCHE